MRRFGFSTGALAKGAVEVALERLKTAKCEAVELSALRISELDHVLSVIDSPDLHRFSYIAFHAPMDYARTAEEAVIEKLATVAKRGWTIVAHPDSIVDANLWRAIGGYLAIENMDRRKSIGKTAEDLDALFRRLPEAGLCLDLGHARQVDPTMTEAFYIIKKHRSRIRQVHVSEVDSNSVHRPLAADTLRSFLRVARFIPESAPVILEPVVAADQIDYQLALARLLFDTSHLIQEAVWPRKGKQRQCWKAKRRRMVLIDGRPAVSAKWSAAFVRSLQASAVSGQDFGVSFKAAQSALLESLGITFGVPRTEGLLSGSSAR